MAAKLDIQKSLAAANGNVKLAKELFDMFTHELNERAARIKSSMQAGDFESLLENTHKLYGATAYCVVPELRDHAGKLENALKMNQLDSLEILVNQTLTSITEIMEEAPNYIAQDWDE